jgi:hypothetical protein
MKAARTVRLAGSENSPAKSSLCTTIRDKKSTTLCGSEKGYIVCRVRKMPAMMADYKKCARGGGMQKGLHSAPKHYKQPSGRKKERESSEGASE